MAHEGPRVRQPRMATIFTVAFAVFGFSLGVQRLWDNSLFWHIRTGEWILDHGIPHHDPYSYTHHGIHWIAQSWLAELLYGVAYRSALGGYGIRLLNGVIFATIAVLALRMALRLSRDVVRAVLVTAASLLGLIAIGSPRPLIFGVLAFLALVWVVELPETRVGRWAPIAIPVIMWFWANTHGTFELGFAYLALHFAGRWLDGHRPTAGPERRLALGSLIALALVFVNPYGVELVLFPIELLRRSDVLSHIMEWQSPSLRTDQGKYFAIWLVVFVGAIAHTVRRLGWRDSMLAATFIILAFWAQRNIILAPLVLLPVFARAVSVDHEREATPVRFGLIFVIMLALLCVRDGVHGATEKNFAFDPYPVKAMRYLDTHGLLGRRILNDDGWGGYIILKFWPRQAVFIDDRYDMYPVSFSNEYFGLADGARGWQKTLRKYNIETVVWPPSRPLSQLLDSSPDWTRVQRDKTAVVFVRKDVLALER